MIKPMLEVLRISLPLTISVAIWEDPMLHLSGLNWSFNSMSAWRIIKDRSVVCACSDSNCLVELCALKNQAIIKVEVQSTSIDIDPVFILSDGSKLEVFSMDTYEPWTMRLPTGEIFVASPSNPHSFDLIWRV